MTTLFVIAGIVYALFALALYMLKVPVQLSETEQASAPKISVLQSIKMAIRDPRLAFFVGGGTMLVATLAASASYIAVPAAMRMAVPEANPGLSLAASLGVTFPFNVLVGIPMYLTWAQWLHQAGG